ncbi:C4-dicarboxylic acid transporter DauA [Thiohalophilus thiocyanatoxydans]|uniref:SulP family sulfate permease n=1 Tax=Thiohalophilus thiocyanatoxydans TaxID=381308 RepID=A0A4R8J2X2_9GAMM|nr:C4-dicarboxylic acid transporter DauA [Thiohalophilus thiocyanatoxydans]TDY04213.1 SulP family sulfate permease [Thiohalophilus thiocyanatoxydans]
MFAYLNHNALINALRDYRLTDLRRDLLAGITVGIVAVPLAMALAIASGVPPQYGLYTAIVAGLIIALTGGSRFSISGPTAAFVVILLPITHEYGLGGLLVTTVMAGIILIIMGVARMGRLIQFIPYPVTIGFTAGIAVVIASLQIKDFFGLTTGEMPQHFLEKMGVLLQALPTAHWPDLLVGLLTLAVLLVWSRLKSRVPGHLVALLLGSLVAWLLGSVWPSFSVATINSQFTYLLDGVQQHGIPQAPPLPLLPWNLPDAGGQPIGLSWQLVRDLLPSAFTVAMLGAIESLLCAVVADGLTGTRHKPDTELIGQGLGNIVAPFFGGIPATAAIARTATNIRAGGRSPIAAIIHALVILLIVISLAGLLGYVPMAALAALLLVVAWNMSEARHFVHILRVAPRCDIVVLLACFSLTVLFDMVIAVAAGLVLAAILFIRRIASLTGAELINPEEHAHLQDIPDNVAVYDINGALFFGAAEKAISTLHHVNSNIDIVVLDMNDVQMIDMTGVVALESLITSLQQQKITVLVANLRPRMQDKLTRAGIQEQPDKLEYHNGLAAIRQRILSRHTEPRN